MEIRKENKYSSDTKIRYSTVFWLFIIGSLFGVLLEGIWYAIDHGGWETHVVTVWGPFCIIYGFGMAGCYVGCKLMEGFPLWKKFLAFSLIGASVEFICGWMILHFLGLRAWDYSGKFLDIMGLTDFNMSVVWGLIGVCFCHIVPLIDRSFASFRGRFCKLVLWVFSAFMAVDLVWSAAVMVRWSSRHWGNAPENAVCAFIDERYDDRWMEERYVEWWFIDDEGPENDSWPHD